MRIKSSNGTKLEFLRMQVADSREGMAGKKSSNSTKSAKVIALKNYIVHGIVNQGIIIYKKKEWIQGRDENLWIKETAAPQCL